VEEREGRREGRIGGTEEEGKEEGWRERREGGKERQCIK